MSDSVIADRNPRDCPDLHSDVALISAAFDASPVGVLVVNAEGVIKLVNQQLLDLLAYERKELVGKPIETIVPSALRGVHVEQRSSYMTDPVTRMMGQRDDIHAEHKNGQQIPVEVGLKVCRVDETVHIVATVNNITARKRAEDAARDSEQRFRELADSAPVLIWMSNAEGECIYCNAQWLSFTGQQLMEVLGNGRATCIHPDDKDRCIAQFHSAHSNRQRFSIEYRLERSDGKSRWIVDTGIPRRDRDGMFIGFVGTCVDVTELKAAQLEQQQLRDEMDSILDHVPSMIWYKNGDNLILRANRAAAASINRTREEVEGQATEEFFPEDAQKYLEDDREVIASETPKFNIVERYIADGKERWIKTDKVPFRDPHGYVQGIIAIATDVTELKQSGAADHSESE